MEPNAKDQIVDRLNSASNVLVTISANPSVDQLAAAIGLTLFLNKTGKHATAVFSGEVPSTIEFLQPEATLEKNTDSLRDFIISLDKAKADKLRYKVEDKFVRIFITPYHTSISEKDLDFGHGDFNVDVIMALGVQKREDLDQALTAHGRILHDATVISVMSSGHSVSELGSIHWQNPEASSLCEMLVDLGQALHAGALDPQMATAFLTGIVAETQRFRNEKTTSQTMSLASILMSAGANQQLVANKLEEKKEPPAKPAARKERPPKDAKSDDDNKTLPPIAHQESPQPNNGTLRIDHIEGKEPEEEKPEPRLTEPPKPSQVEPNDLAQINIDESGMLRSGREAPRPLEPEEPVEGPGTSDLTNTSDEPTAFTATAHAEPQDPSTDPLSATSTERPIMTHNSSHQEDKPPSVQAEHVDAARQAVQSAAQFGPDPLPEPSPSLNSWPLGPPLHPAGPPPPPLENTSPEPSGPPAPQEPKNDTPPPPVPPPMMPPIMP